MVPNVFSLSKPGGSSGTLHSYAGVCHTSRSASDTQLFSIIMLSATKRV